MPWKKNREKLEALLVALERRVEKVDRHRRREDGPLSPDFAEQAVTRENDEVLDGLEEEGLEQIDLIRDALSRMDLGSYGECEDCGGKIGRARIDALPYAITCIGCAEKREKARANA